ncbi:MAG: GntR family transcriptional regulator [Hoeflea sp.]|uniref:GntR family transcriptional regulator n=1 Tax=Hoeflea sp. TaxID=1940281 RepID=UPI00272FB03C|nr:GntR family transcriptional regulator [Hoeflea sp.]MDP2122692.1 GntR family transcriptional regulator [Hoeflea sp.]MDP3525241.1 GntR family transcriptional regulator [Hoeflea sp.]MDZ7603231.1 GntR family transcriptional regulator [Hoeflea sp.]
MALKSIKQDRPRLADIVYNQLLEAIRTGAISDDERLVQEKLADEMQISRTPVREALLRLEQEGILVVANNGGFKVYRMSHIEVHELYQARTAVEGQAARILAANPDPVKMQELRKFIEKEEDISSPSIETYFTANRNIHRKIVELSANRYLLDMFDNIWNRGISYNLFAAIAKIDLAKSLGDHLVLVDAIETGSASTAMEAIADHIAHGLDLQIEALEKDA